MNLLAELRRRNVFRVAAAYLISGWAVMQVVSLIATASGLPEWTTSFVLMLVIAGLPIALIVAWAFEITPEGVKQTDTSEKASSVRPFSVTDGVLLAGLAVVIGFIGWQQLAGPRSAQVAADDRMTGQSIAVLPFVAISETTADVVLGDGLAEELLNVLAQFPDLMVAGRTSSFSFRDRSEDIPAIGAALGVSHVLEGSVRRSGEQIRVTAQLIRVADGFHIWSGNYDRPFTDILQVQDDIVRRIAQVLTIRLGLSSTTEHGNADTNPAAYEQYLQGRYLFADRGSGANRYAAIEAFQTAVDIDPDFSAAWAALARAILYSGAQEGQTEVEFAARGRRAAERALALDPDNAEALASLGYWAVKVEKEWATADAYLARALELAPNAALVHYTQAIALEFYGDDERLAAAFRRALALDPLNLVIRRNVAERYSRMGRFAEAQRLLETTGQNDPFARIYVSFDQAEMRRDPAAASQAVQEWNTLLNSQGFVDEYDNAAYLQVVSAISEGMSGDFEAARRRLPAVSDLVEAGRLIQADLGDIYYNLGDYEAAAQAYRASAENPEEGVLGYIATGMRRDIPAFLCQPDYQALWELPGMPELAEIRRANGATENLPLSGPECDEWVGDTD